jgi:hypothetical protein
MGKSENGLFYVDIINKSTEKSYKDVKMKILSNVHDKESKMVMRNCICVEKGDAFEIFIKNINRNNEEEIGAELYIDG